MNVKLIALTQGAGELKGKSAQEIITYTARVSNPPNQGNFRTAAKLLEYCIKEKHFSIFQQASMTLEVNTTRGIGTQILRHRSFEFQEFCLDGDSKISIGGENNAVQRITIRDLFESWNSNKRIVRTARAYDTQTERFITAPIKSVYKSGDKPVYEFNIQSPNSQRSIKCTREHRVLTKERKFVPFGEAYDNNLTIALNGQIIEIPPYQRKEILESESWMGSTKFAEKYNIAPVTSRKWFKKFKIITHNPRHSSAKSCKITSPFKSKLGSFMKWARNNIRKSTCEFCHHDGTKNRLEMSHIIDHNGNSSLAFDENNLRTLCSKCHRQYDIEVQNKNFGWNLNMTAKWGKIISQTYLGIRETFDIEMDHPTHNFVADGVVVHNSMRYSDTKLLNNHLELPELRKQDTKNRQNSTPNLPPGVVKDYENKINKHFEDAMYLYDSLLDSGVAKECARFVLPLAAPTRIYMSGTARSWITYIALREKNGTQKEHQLIALECKKIFCEQFPDVAEALGGLNSPWIV